MKVDLVDAIDELWCRDFGDVPWRRQALSIRPTEGGEARLFQFVVEGGAGMFQITPCHRSGGQGPLVDLDPDLYELSQTPDQLGILLRIAPGPAVDCIRIEQAGLECPVAKAVCLQHDPAQDQWEVIYNSIDRHKRLLASARERVEQSSVPFKTDLIDFLTHLLAHDIRRTSAAFEKSPALRKHQAGLQRLTERFELQLNAHGLKRTFKFWTTHEKVRYLEGARDLMQALRGVSPHVCLGFGAVLGHVRDQDLIGHDDDLDILVAFQTPEVPDLGRALARAEQALQGSGFEVVGHFFSHLWVRTPGGHRADVFVGLIEDGDQLAFYPSARHSLQLPDVFPAVDGHLHGVALAMPANCLGYLANTYGASWREPDIQFAHPWDRQAYADIAGARSKPAIWTRGELARRTRAT